MYSDVEYGYTPSPEARIHGDPLYPQDKPKKKGRKKQSLHPNQKQTSLDFFNK